jgi:DNA-binding NtrC family response regulator
MPIAHMKNPRLSALLLLYESDSSDLRAFVWIEKALRECDGNVGQASEMLQVHRQTIYKWFRKFPDLKRRWERIQYEVTEKRKALGRSVNGV